MLPRCPPCPHWASAFSAFRSASVQAGPIQLHVTAFLEAKSSKHRKKDVLPLHPELAAVLPSWLHGLKATLKLFPGLGRKRGIADFHAAGRHTHITELLRNGATLPEAQKLDTRISR